METLARGCALTVLHTIGNTSHWLVVSGLFLRTKALPFLSGSAFLSLNLQSCLLRTTHHTTSKNGCCCAHPTGSGYNSHGETRLPTRAIKDMECLGFLVTR